MLTDSEVEADSDVDTDSLDDTDSLKTFEFVSEYEVLLAFISSIARCFLSSSVIAEP